MKSTTSIRNIISVFYHIACMNNWRDIFKEQITLLRANGFSKLNLTVLGAQKDLKTAISLCTLLDVKAKIIFNSIDFSHFEKPALLAIEEHVRKHDGYVLYLHGKGVSNPNDKDKIRWRHLMMDELIENSEYCLRRLRFYDFIGVNWRDMPPISHFSGNFWYASNKYLRKLPDFISYYERPLFPILDSKIDKRKGCEFWIGSNSEKPHVLSLAFENEDFCDHNFWEKYDRR